MPHPLFADDGRSRGSCYSKRCGGMAGPNSRPIRERRCVRANCPRGRCSPSDFRRPSAMAERDCSKHPHVKLG